MEEQIRLYHLGTWLILAGVFPSDRRVEFLELHAGTCLQHIPKLLPVGLRRLYFETVDVRIRHHAVIERVCLAFLRDFCAALFSAKVSKCCKKDLECGQALLAVYHLASSHVSSWCPLLIENHCSEEVERCIAAALYVLSKFVRNVFPKGFPMPLTVPYVLSLEQRHFDLHLRLEEIEHCCCVCFH